MRRVLIITTIALVALVTVATARDNLGVTYDQLTKGWDAVFSKQEAITDASGNPGLRLSGSKVPALYFIWGPRDAVYHVSFIVPFCVDLDPQAGAASALALIGCLNSVFPGWDEAEKRNWIMSAIKELLKNGEQRHSAGCIGIFSETDIFQIHKNAKITIRTIPPMLWMDIEPVKFN